MKIVHPINFVSLGSGDPELITLKALRALQNADVILTPSTMNRETEMISRSKSILTELHIDENKIELFHVPMSKMRANALDSYDAVALQASDYYSEGLKVAIVAEGDSGFYSSSQYINEKLVKIGIPTERIAGVPAFIACGSLANIHVVKQDEQLVVIPGKTDAKELSSYLMSRKSIVIMKPSQSEMIIKEFVGSRDTVESYYFENAGVFNLEFYTSNKAEIIARKFPYFSLLIIKNSSSI